jgi:hypothetical protein
VYRKINKSSRSAREYFDGKHRFEHWYVDNQVNFITGCCRDHFPAFRTDEAKLVFWDRIEHYCAQYHFYPWVASLMSNHYHLVGYNRLGSELKHLMQRFHGSVAKLVNDRLPQRREDFWRDQKGREYFDGCLRDEKQARCADRYTRMQARRHGIMYDYLNYPHTRVYIPIDPAIKRALELEAFLENVPYRRYE